MKGLIEEFKQFALKGNVVDMAVGIIIGTAIGLIAKSLVSDMLMPVIGLLVGGADFSNLFVTLKNGVPAGPYLSMADAVAAGAVTINYGLFLNTVVSFFIAAVPMFLLVRAINNMRRKAEPIPPPSTTRECPFCISQIPDKATRCPHCTSALG